MPLTLRTNGNNPINIVSASWWNDFYNLLTGVMTDQPVTIANTVTSTKFISNGTLGASNQIADFQQSFGLFSDNTASTFSGATSRLWIQAGGATGTQEIHIGPRSGNVALAGLRVLASNILYTPNGAAAGSFQVTGGMTTILDGGQITTDGAGTLRLNSKWLNWQGTLGGTAKQMFGFAPTDAGTKSWGFFYNTDNSIGFYNATDNKTSLRCFATGGFQSDAGALSTDGSGNLTTSGFLQATGNITTSGNFIGPIGGGIPMTRNGAAVSVPMFSGTTTPTSPPTGAVWIKA